MARLIQLTIFAALALLTFAAPAPYSSRSLSKRSFKAKAPGRRQRSGLEDIARTKRKYSDFWEIVIIGSGEGGSPPAPPAASTITITPTTYPAPFGTTTPSGVPSGPPTYGNTTTVATAPSASPTAGSEDGTVAANPEDETESAYLSPVTIGGQKFDLDFDTGSADLWVYGAQAAGSGRTAFSPNKSSSWKRMSGASWEIQYGDGSSAHGYVGTDVVDVGGSTVQKQAVEVAEQVSQQFQRDQDLDGLLGLAFSSINNVSPRPQLTFFDNVKSDLSQPLFTADLEDSRGKGTYDFGTIDESKYTGDIHYTPVNTSRGYWQIETPRLLLGEQGYDCSDCSVAIVDTGTSLIYLDDDVVTAYYSQIASADQSAGQWVYPCSQQSNLPSLGIYIGDWVAHINGTDMNYSEYDLGDGSSLCLGGLQSNAGMGLSILGDVFLKQFFVVFDGGETRVGIANKD